MSLGLPDKLVFLHRGEEQLRDKALESISTGQVASLHLVVVERAMDLADILRQFPTDDEDLKLIQILAMRCFNDFAAALKLALSGYSQNSAILLRDLLETVFLIDLFRGERMLIAEWRDADKNSRMRKFGPVHVRIKLDQRDGFTGLKRAAMYDMFSELAAHPTMQSSAMLRPLNMDAQIGPFIDDTVLTAVVAEMGRLALQVGEQIYEFVPRDWEKALPARAGFLDAKRQWLVYFYPDSVKP